MEDTNELENILGKLKEADKWLFDKFYERYNPQFAEKLMKEISDTISPDLEEDSCKELVDSYSLVKKMPGMMNYFSTSYIASVGFLKMYEGNDDQVSEESQKYIDNVVNSSNKFIKFAETLSGLENLDTKGIERSLVAVFPTVEDFSSGFNSFVEIVFYEILRNNRTDGEEPPEEPQEGSGGILNMKMLEREIYNNKRQIELTAKESIRINQEFSLKAYQQILGDIYEANKVID